MCGYFPATSGALRSDAGRTEPRRCSPMMRGMHRAVATGTGHPPADGSLADVRQISTGRNTGGPHAPFRPSSHSLGNRLSRALWGLTWLLLFRPSPKILHGWRRWLLRRFGARIGEGAAVHSSVRIWGPWNLEMGPFSCLSPQVDCYAVNTVRIGAYATISQYCFLCTASHDPDTSDMQLTTAPIAIGDHAWVAADAFVGPGVTIGEGAVIGARSTVVKDVSPWG